MDINVKELQTAFPPATYQLRGKEIIALVRYAQLDTAGALFAAYNYGFIRGQRAEKNTQKKRRTGKKAVV